MKFLNKKLVGVEFRHLPWTKPVAVNKVLRYRAACDMAEAF